MTAEELAAQKAAAHDKKRYVRFKTVEGRITVTPAIAEQMLADSEWGACEREDVWLTDEEWEAMREY